MKKKKHFGTTLNANKNYVINFVESAVQSSQIKLIIGAVKNFWVGEKEIWVWYSLLS